MIEIEINGFRWNVNFVKKNDKELDGAWGICLNYKQTILVCKDLHPQLIYECLIHEITHAWLMTSGRGGKIKMETEEICEFMGFCGVGIIEKARSIMDNYWGSRHGKIRER